MTSQDSPAQFSFANLAAAWTPVVVWGGLIFWLSSIPSLSTGWGLWDLILRKWAHIVEFAVFAFLTARAFAKAAPAQPPGRRLLLSLGLSLLYAMSDEFHQGFVPGRQASALDVAIDSVGCVAGVHLYRRWWKS